MPDRTSSNESSITTLNNSTPDAVITTRGGVLTGDASGDAQELALGTADQMLGSDGTDVVYLDSIHKILTTRGDTVREGVSGAERLALGLTGEALVSDGTDMVWGAGINSLLTTRGDTIRRGASAGERLALGAQYQALMSDGTDVYWDYPTPPPVTYDLSGGTVIDAHNGAYQTDTITSPPAFTASNFKTSWVVKLILTNSGGTVAEPNWPGTEKKLGTGTWDDANSAVNHVWISYDGTNYEVTIAQEA
jgi:hypothetical protein